MLRVLMIAGSGAILLGGLFVAQADAADVHASQLLPDSTVAFVEISKPAEILSTLIDHPLSKHIKGLEAYQTATSTEGYQKLVEGIDFFENQIGAKWRPAVDDLLAQGVSFAFDAATNGSVLLMRAKDTASMENFRVRLLELTRLQGGQSGKPVDYRGTSIYRLGKGGAAVVREWLIVTNEGDLGKMVLDRLIDLKPDAANEPVPGTLSSQANYATAYATRDAGSDLWAFANVEAVRNAGAGKKALEGKAENPLAEVLFGGIQSTLLHSPFVTANVDVAPSGLTMRLSTPWQADWIPEERTYFFGPENSGEAPSLPQVPEPMMTLGVYRDVSQMWLRAGDLFDEQMNDKLAEADSGLTTVFAGRDFGEEILGSFDPQMGVVVTRQDFSNTLPLPAIKLPAFALVMKLRDPDTMRAELRRTFQSAIGFFNIIGAQNGQPQLEMDMEKSGDIDLITSQYLPEKKDRESTSAPIFFNFSPSVGFVGDRFVLASTKSLARQLSDAPLAPDSAGVNTNLVINAGPINEILNDNREQLISQNMLEEGHSREEAEGAINLLLELVKCFRSAQLELDREGDRLELNAKLNVVESL